MVYGLFDSLNYWIVINIDWSMFAWKIPYGTVK